MPPTPPRPDVLRREAIRRRTTPAPPPYSGCSAPVAWPATWCGITSWSPDGHRVWITASPGAGRQAANGRSRPDLPREAGEAPLKVPVPTLSGRRDGYQAGSAGDFPVTSHCGLCTRAVLLRDDYRLESVPVPGVGGHDHRQASPAANSLPIAAGHSHRRIRGHLLPSRFRGVLRPSASSVAPCGEAGAVRAPTSGSGLSMIVSKNIGDQIQDS